MALVWRAPHCRRVSLTPEVLLLELSEQDVEVGVPTERLGALTDLVPGLCIRCLCIGSVCLQRVIEERRLQVALEGEVVRVGGLDLFLEVGLAVEEVVEVRGEEVDAVGTGLVLDLDL